ncbi:MAG TPA: response regulator transcription factor [Polyangiaceae bacterium]|nr:response regulator transcription factor [Polyangiaceae bacterium]
MKILLADDHAIMREGLRVILERMPSVEVVGETDNGRDAVRMARELRPDILLMDISMPGLNGVDATRLITGTLPNTRVIGLSMHADRRYVLSMLTSGASGYLLKRAASSELALAIEAVAAGHKYVSPAIADAVIEALPKAATQSAGPDISPREREVLQLLAEGRTSKEIAAILDVAVTTVETHRRQLMERLHIHSVAELTKYAVREGLTSLND